MQKKNVKMICAETSETSFDGVNDVLSFIVDRAIFAKLVALFRLDHDSMSSLVDCLSTSPKNCHTRPYREASSAYRELDESV
jgi:hypothetical protein